MKNKLNLLAVAIFVVAIGIWASGGFHTGWTQTSIEVHGVDEITGIEYTTTKDGFVPGIEFPIAGFSFALLITALSLGLRKIKSRPKS